MAGLLVIRGRRWRLALMCGVSLLALTLRGPRVEARNLYATQGAPSAAQAAAQVAAEQAAAAGLRSRQSIQRAAEALAAARQFQLDAAAAARASAGSLPNGIGRGGLMPLNGTDADPLAGLRDVSLNQQDARRWTGALAPRQWSTGGKTVVEIPQIDKKAILTWETFNVGADTTVNFQQGASDWIALNRIFDPSARPSRILGTINAPGGVYLINRNGIVFGAGSQVNVHSLVASSLDVGGLSDDIKKRNAGFLSGPSTLPDTFSLYAPVEGGSSTYDPVTKRSSDAVGGDIVVERGARIKAFTTFDQSLPGSFGSVVLMGANVFNSGFISTPTGEAALIAGRTVKAISGGELIKRNPPTDETLVPKNMPFEVLGTDDQGKPVRFRGIDFNSTDHFNRYLPSDGSGEGGVKAGTGLVMHDGLIEAAGGITYLTGSGVAIRNPQGPGGGTLRDEAGRRLQGVISIDTGVTRNGMAFLLGQAVTMDGVISSQPYDDGGPGLPRGKAFVPTYVSAGDLGPNALISAPSAYVNLGTRLAPGAVVDVAGLSGVKLPASYNYISYAFKDQFADMPLQRPPYAEVDKTTGLGTVYGRKIWFDIRASGTRADGTTWVGSPLFDASGVVAALPRGIEELMTVGGKVFMAGGFNDLSFNPVVTAGAVINLAGGSVEFLPGYVRLTRLIGSDGRIYSIDKADPNMTYIGIAGSFSVKHRRWGVTETWVTERPILAPGYREGRDAGALRLGTIDSTSLAGDFYFGSLAGERQRLAGKAPNQGSLALGGVYIQIGDKGSAYFQPAKPEFTAVLSADRLSGFGLSSLRFDSFYIPIGFTTYDFTPAIGGVYSFSVSPEAVLRLAPGGALTINGAGPIDIAGSIIAPGGSVSINASFNGRLDLLRFPVSAEKRFNVDIGGAIDVSGRFVNDRGSDASRLIGPGFIDGGRIAIVSTSRSSNALAFLTDVTGDIRLAPGSLLDVSSGAYIAPDGRAKTASAGMLAGRAGSIVLATAYSALNDPGSGNVRAAGRPARILLDGELRGWGFQTNAGLTLTGVETLRLGGALAPGEVTNLMIAGKPSVVPLDLLNGGGFGAYVLRATTPGWQIDPVTRLLTNDNVPSNLIVSERATIAPRQVNFDSTANYADLPTGTRLSDAPRLATLPDDRRVPVSTALQADNVRFEPGSQWIADPRASITISGSFRDFVPARNVVLAGTISAPGGALSIEAGAIRLAATALVDLSGTFVAASNFGVVSGPRVSGVFVQGGTFSAGVSGGRYLSALPDYDKNRYFDANSTSTIIAEQGAVVDVSGAAGDRQVMLGRARFAPQWVWSDAGSVDLSLSGNNNATSGRIGLAWGGDFLSLGGRYRDASGRFKGDPRANNGSFQLAVSGNQTSTSPDFNFVKGLELRQDRSDLAAKLAEIAAGLPLERVLVAADQLAGFDSVSLTVSLISASIARPLLLSGPLDWRVANRLSLTAPAITALPGVDARLAAPYVQLGGYNLDPNLTGQSFQLPDGSLTNGSRLALQARLIDISRAFFQGFDRVSLNADGDIRLSSPDITDFTKTTFSGGVLAGGDLSFTAQRVYPVTRVQFSILTPGNVEFAAPAGASRRIPLSAGGSLTVKAAEIRQNGQIFAPLGEIALGNSDGADPTGIVTQGVTLGPGSLTSASLAGTLVPFGETQNGAVAAFYNKPPLEGSLGSLQRPPAKRIVLAGADIQQQPGALIDLSGGGDLQFMEWIKGLGGSRDTLRTTPLGQTVYALVPSRDDAFAAIDPHFQAERAFTNLAAPKDGINHYDGDTVPLAGQQIRLDGGGGIAAGVYTLYPAHYATLPGAMRVVVQTKDNSGANLPSGTVLADGTVLVTGNDVQSTAPGKQSAGQTVYAVRPYDIWQRYSEYAFTSATSYFATKAQRSGTLAPRLPIDGGRLAVVAQQNLLLAGLSLSQPARDAAGRLGRGGELDLSAQRIAVVGDRADAPQGYVAVTPGAIRGFDSVLVGGLRSDVTAGTRITPAADQVLIDTRGVEFSAPELIFVARPPSVAQDGGVNQTFQLVGKDGGFLSNVILNIPTFGPGAGFGAIRVESGSVVAARGIVNSGFGRNFILDEADAADIARLLGGTLSSDGKTITGADLARLPGIWDAGKDPIITFPSLTSDMRLAVRQALANFAMGGRGAMLALTNDPALGLTGFGFNSRLDLTIGFTGGVTGGSETYVAPTDRVTLVAATATPRDYVLVSAGARLVGDAISVQATGATGAVTIRSTDFSARRLSITTQTLAAGGGAEDRAYVAVNARFADIGALYLRALTGSLAIRGDFDPGVSQLIIDAAGLVAQADSARLAARDLITLTDSGASSADAAQRQNARLRLDAARVELGTAVAGGQAIPQTFTIAGFSNVVMATPDSVILRGQGQFDFGGADVTVQTPLLRVAGTTRSTGSGGEGFTFTTTGALSIGPAPGQAPGIAVDDNADIAGKALFTASSVTLSGTLAAQAGAVTLKATSGNVTVAPGGSILARGYAKALFDVVTYGAGGSVTLAAPNGAVSLAPGSRIDVSNPGGQGYAGAVDLSAKGRVDLGALLQGAGGPGLGGRFTLDSGGPVDLTALADGLLAGGFTRAVDIRGGQGNLTLAAGHTLKANRVTLTADDQTWGASGQFGRIVIAGTLDARGYDGRTGDGSGQAGGQVGLFGYNGVTLQSGARVLASTSHQDERGGDVLIGLAWGAKGAIDLQPGSLIDVSGGTKGGLSGGTLTLRAPLTQAGDVKIAQIASDIVGARAITIQPYIAIDTKASGAGLDGSKLKTKDGTNVAWDGIIDPGGQAGKDGKPIDWGRWSNLTGAQLVSPGDFGSFDVVPNITVVDANDETHFGEKVGDFYEVTDPVTGTTFRSSLQITAVTIDNGGIYALGENPIVSFVDQSGRPVAGPSPTIEWEVNDTNITSLRINRIYRSKTAYLIDKNQNILGSSKISDDGRFLQSVDLQQSGIPVSLAVIGDDGSTELQRYSLNAIKFTASIKSVSFVNAAAGFSGSIRIRFSAPAGNPTKAATGKVIMGGAVTVVSTSRGYLTNSDLGTANIPKSITLDPDLNGNSIQWSLTADLFGSDFTSGFRGTSNESKIFTPLTGDFIPKLADGGGYFGDAVRFEVDPNLTHQRLYSEVLSDYVSGKGLGGFNGYGFGGVFNRLGTPLAQKFGANVVHVQPGLDLVNSSSDVNGGKIVVASNWNFAAGTARDLVDLPYLSSATGLPAQGFDPAQSSVEFTYRLATPWGGIEPGALSLRAAGNIELNASISDGFFQFANRLDQDYVNAISTFLLTNWNLSSSNNSRNTGPYLGPDGIFSVRLPLAPYQDAGNIVSPSSLDLAVADLFPYQLRIWCATCGPDGKGGVRTIGAPASWTYRLTAGAPVASANPSRRLADSPADISLDKYQRYQLAPANFFDMPTMLRTGTGAITVTAARDVVLKDPLRPGVIYAAGVNSKPLTEPVFKIDGSAITIVNGDQPNLFSEPQLANSFELGPSLVSSQTYRAPATAAAFPEQAGDVAIEAGRDIIGNITRDWKNQSQYFWLQSRASAMIPQQEEGVTLFGAGVFTPNGAKLNGTQYIAYLADQTAWWLQFSAFQQGFLSAGGNLDLIAGRDLVGVSASVPTTGRVSGGLTPILNGRPNVPVTHLYGGGNLSARVGRDILGGTYYVGSGHGVIETGGVIDQYGSIFVLDSNNSPMMVADRTLLMLDTGQLSVTTRGSMILNGVGNPAGLRGASDDPKSPTGAFLYLSTSGQDSKARIVAERGDLTIRQPDFGSYGQSSDSITRIGENPASFEALALAGSLDLGGAVGPDGKVQYPVLRLSPSLHGTLQLLAAQDVKLTQYISAGPSLIQTGFDPFRPNLGFNQPFTGTILAHADDADDGLARIYAVGGDISERTINDDTTAAGTVGLIQINRPARVRAGRDIVNLFMLGQNIHADEVTSVIAGRDFTGGLRIAGPGFLLVQAGGDLGPFPAPNLSDLATQGILSVGAGTRFPVGNSLATSQSRGSNDIGQYDDALLGPYTNPRRNAFLPLAAGTTRGASIAALAGVAFGADYDAVTAAYIDPAGAAAGRRNYLPELRDFLDAAGLAAPAGDAAAFAAFKALSPELQHIFIYRLLTSELKSVGVDEAAGRSPNYPRAYSIIEMLFPGRLGYTANPLTGGVNGAASTVRTGDVNLLHATIQTQLGGDIDILAPGGNLIIGTIAPESNDKLKLRDLGVMTLGQGYIHTFSDKDVQVNSSRMLTTQGGDILIWSSNGDIDAGRGSRTAFSAPSLQINFDEDFYPSVDLGGFVSGSGIGTLQVSAPLTESVPTQPETLPSNLSERQLRAKRRAALIGAASDVFLLAPRGIINIGTAGVRVSGNAVLVAPVVLNTSGLEVKGTTVGVPTTTQPNIGALTSANNAAAAGNQFNAPNPEAARRASIYTVEILGYGGGEGEGGPGGGSGDGPDERKRDRSASASP